MTLGSEDSPICGLVGVAGNLLPRDVSYFKQALHADEFRGVHSTGITRVVHPVAADMEVEHVKMALPISQFKYMPMYKMMVDNTLHTTALLGHNRHATKGAADNHAYAHPFQHGHINLMHNGSLVTHAHLTTEHFTVDSEAICKALVTTSIEELVPKLRGAFALVWTDSNEQTLNFVRNDERPLALAFNHKRNTIYWASEKDMLHWLLNREGITTNKVDYDEIVVLPIGEVWSFPMTKNSVNIKDMIKTPVELTEAYSYTQYQRGSRTVGKPTTTATTTTTTVVTSPTYTNMDKATVKEGLDVETAKYRHNTKTETALTAQAKQDIEKLGRGSTGFRTFVANVDQKSLTELESRIGIYVSSFAEYKGNTTSNLGEVKGRMIEYPYSACTLHAVSKEQYESYVNEGERLVTGYFSVATVPDDLKYRHCIDDEKDMQRFNINIKYGSICLLRTITDWSCEGSPIEAVREMYAKEVDALPLLVATAKK